MGIAPGALLAVVGFGAPQPGTHVEVGGGLGAYHYSGGCSGPHNYANFAAGQARVRHLESNGLVVAAEAAGQRDEVVRSDGGSMSEVGRRDTFYVAVVRAGYEGKYFGFELGPGVLRGGGIPGVLSGGIEEGRHRPSTSLVPSLKVWGGRYGLLHGWTAVLADQALPMNRLFAFGIGHASHHARASLGLAGSGGDDATVILDGDMAVGESGVWLGMGGQFTDNTHTWGLLWRVGYFWGGATAQEKAARRAAEPGIEPEPPSPAPVPQPVVSPAPAAPDAAPAPSGELPGGDGEADAGA